MQRNTASVTRPVICCGCSQQCGLRVHLTAGRVTRITGDRHHPSSAGFICPKGAHAHELHYHADRVHTPLKRVGARGGGRWQRIGWDQALDEITAKLVSIAAESGPEAVAYGYGTLHGADWGIGERFMNLFGSPNTVGQDKICYGPTAVGESLTYGFGPTVFTYPVPSVTRCVVVWGMRPSASAPLLWRQILRARAAGASLVVIDPEHTKEAHKADLWLPILPGTDAALGLGLIHAIVAADLYDHEFVERETLGFEALRERAREFPPARVAELTGVPTASIDAAARLIATRGPTLLAAGNGLCQGGRMAVQNGRVIACVVALTGNIGREGGHRLAGPPRDIVSNGAAMAAGALSPAQRARRLGAATFPLIGAGHDAIDSAMSRAWYGQRHLLSWTATAHEPALWRAITTGDPYPVRALILQHHNPIGASANLGAAAAALTSPRLELLVAHDLFINASSSLADYLLPAAHWLEKPFFSLGYGYLAFAGDYVETQFAPLAPDYEHRSDYDLWRDLGGRLGQAEHWPATAEAFWQTLLAPAALDFAALAALPGPLIGAGGEGPAAYGTPSGRVEFESSLLAAWGLDPLPHYRQPDIFAGAADYPLVLTTGGRVIEGFHQNAQQMPWFRRKYAEPVVRLHPQTAARCGVEDGAYVEVATPVGSVRQRARLTGDVRPGVVQADRWWFPEGSDDPADPFGVHATNINVCTDDAPANVDPVMGSWLLRGLPCRIGGRRLTTGRPDGATV